MAENGKQAAEHSRWEIRTLAVVAGAYAVIGGLISLSGWILNIPHLADWGLTGINIKPNAALAIISAGIGLVLWLADAVGGKWAIRALGFLTFMIAILTLAEHFLGIDVGIDTFLFTEEAGAAATSSPGRMGVPASTALTLIGTALLFLTSERYRRWTGVLGAGALGISILPLIGYGFGADLLYAVPRLTGIAWQTATMIAALGIGISIAVPNQGLAGMATRNDSGGLVFRRLFVPLVLVSIALGWFQVLGQKNGLYDAAFGSAVRTLLEIALLLGLLWWTAGGVSRRETQIREGAAALSERDEHIHNVLESLSDSFISLDADLRFVQINAAARSLFAENGVEPSTVIDKKLFDVFPEARAEKLGQGLIQCHEQRMPMEMEEFYHPFRRWFHTRFFPTGDGGISIFALDITERKNAEILLARSARELAVLFNFTDKLNRAESLEQVYESALDAIERSLDCQRASILLFDEQDVMSFVAARGLSQGYMDAVNGHSPWKPGEKGAKPIGIDNIHDAEIDPALKETIAEEGITALGFIPLISNDELIGKFMVYYDEAHHFTEAEFEIALTVGYQIAFGVQKKRTEEALRENEERLRLATQTGKVGVWDWDIIHDRIAWTPTVYAMHGIEPGEFDGTVEHFAALVHPDDREFVRQRIEQALAGDSQYELELRIPTKDGNANWLFTSAVVLRNNDGHPTRMIGATVDITQSKIAERELARVAAIVNSSRDAIVGKNLDGVVTSWNRGAERLFGYTADEMIGESITKVIPNDRLEEETEILAKLRRGEYIDHYETIRQRKDGTLIDLSLSVSPVIDAKGNVIGASKIARDITERRKAEAAMRDREIMSRLVDAQEAERHRIARDLHDHLGQQLTALRLKLESAKAKCNGNNLMTSELEDLQKYALRIDMDLNYLAWELRPTELDQLGLENALASFVREWSKTYGISAEFHTSKTADQRLHPDIETNLYRIVQEALNNILKHAKASNVDVLLESRSGQIVLIIEDDGIGFDPNLGPNGRPGGGLGLVGMRERTALLGGTLEIESRPGEGTTLFVRVPNAPPNPNQSLVDPLAVG